jgi:PAS domain S-box-containing protein
VSTPETRERALADLRHQVAELTQAVEAQRQIEAQLIEAEQRLRRLLDSISEAVAFNIGGILMEVNSRFESMLGYEAHELIGTSGIDLALPEFRERIRKHIEAGFFEPYEAVFRRKDGTTFTGEISAQPASYQGRSGRVTVLRDITERKRAEEALRAALVQEEVIRAQRSMLAELSMPLLPISDDIVVLPLIGAVTAERAEQIMTTLVEGVARHRAKTAILDITGVPSADAQVAGALLRAARAAELLGARVVLTGIRPDVAQRLVQLGADLTGLVTCGSLQRGVAHALGRR